MGCVNGGVEVTEPVPCPFFVVTLSGQNRQREGTALGLDDLPALYSQMVRSIVTGRPMDGFNVVDRTNVTEAQEASRKRVQSDSFGYARLGYGSVFGDRGYGGPILGFGYRAELDTFGIDVSFPNYEVPSSGSGNYYGSSPDGISGSLTSPRKRSRIQSQAQPPRPRPDIVTHLRSSSRSASAGIAIEAHGNDRGRWTTRSCEDVRAT